MQERAKYLLLESCYLLIDEYPLGKTSVYMMKRCLEMGQSF